MSNEFNETMRIEIPSDKKSVKEIIKIVLLKRLKNIMRKMSLI